MMPSGVYGVATIVPIRPETLGQKLGDTCFCRTGQVGYPAAHFLLDFLNEYQISVLFPNALTQPQNGRPKVQGRQTFVHIDGHQTKPSRRRFKLRHWNDR